MPTPKTCRVSYVDPSGLEHSVEVVAGELHEAALKALDRFAELKSEGFAELLGPNARSVLKVAVRTEEHFQIRVSHAQDWLEAKRSPRAAVAKKELKAQLKSLFPDD